VTNVYKPRRTGAVRMRLHYTWLFGVILITLTVSSQFTEIYSLWQRVIIGTVASLLFLAVIAGRELILSYMTTSRQIPLRTITLYVFGGVSQVSREDTVPHLELLSSGAGFIFNLVVAGIFYGIHALLVNTGNFMIADFMRWMALIWSMLFLFHFIPGFPLDGGRILRALIWRTTGNYYRATDVASLIGWIIGWLLILGGVLVFAATREWLTSSVVLFAGWFLQSAAGQSRRQAILLRVLDGVTAQDIMTREWPQIGGELTIEQLVRNYVLITGWNYFVVATGTKLQGVVTMRIVNSVHMKRWNYIRVADIMIPASQLKTSHPEQSAASLLEQMEQSRLTHMLVLEEGNVVGLVAWNRLVLLGKTRAKLGVY